MPEITLKPDSSYTPHKPNENGSGKGQILVIDDEADIRESLETLLSLEGYTVSLAQNGGEGLRALETKTFDLVLLDLMMPDMSGYEVAKRMRQETWGRDATIVAVSGWGQEAHRRQTREAGFDGHLTKPADIAALQALLEERPRPHSAA
jgi:CheY-like chemotaxis protein